MDETKLAKKDDLQRSQSDGRATIAPAVDVVEDPSGITLYADLPGVSKDKLGVRVEGDTLTLEGDIDLPSSSGVEASHAEIRFPRYLRQFTLGKELDSGRVVAEFRQGVLKLQIPKAEHAKPRKIEVQVG